MSTPLLSVNEDEALLGDQGVFGHAAAQLLRRDPPQDSSTQLMGRRVSYGGAALVSASAKLAFIPITLKLPGGAFWATTYCLGFFALEFWASSSAIREALGPKTSGEIALQERSRLRPRTRWSILACATPLACASQLPSGFAAYHYNQKSVRLIAALITVAANALFPLRSLQLTITRLLRERPQTLLETQLAQLKQRLIHQLNQLSSTPASEEEGLNVESLSPSIFLASMLTAHSPPSIPCLNRAAFVLGLLATVSMEYGLGVFTYESVQQQILESSLLGGCFATAVVGVELYLVSNQMGEIVKRLLSHVTRHKMTVVDTLRPHTMRAVMLISMSLSASCLGATFVIWRDFFQQHPKYGPKPVMQPLQVMAMFLLLLSSVTNLADVGVETALSRYGTPTEKRAIMTRARMLEMKRLLEVCSYQDFAAFLYLSPSEQGEQLLEGSAIDRANLASYCTLMGVSRESESSVSSSG